MRVMVGNAAWFLFESLVNVFFKFWALLLNFYLILFSYLGIVFDAYQADLSEDDLQELAEQAECTHVNIVQDM